MSPPPHGILIPETAQVLRHYLAAFKGLLRACSGWFLVVRHYEDKYRLAYLAYDAMQNADVIIRRLREMRGGKPNASIRPDLTRWIQEWTHAPDETSFWQALNGHVLPELQRQLQADFENLDPSANANEARLLREIQFRLDTGPDAPSRRIPVDDKHPWLRYLRRYQERLGGLHGPEVPALESPERPGTGTFQRPRTLHFDERIQIGPLMGYEERSTLAPNQATIEQFKVFFNEFYAAALLASVLFDAYGEDYPWEFFADFTRHFWDEARHSEFGAIRLRELGVDPSQINPVLFQEVENLPILHRITYLTRGLEAYFMPRKPKRLKEYLENHDTRSQLFADQDWSDEINHVRYGSRWTEHLLENDMRDIDEIIDEVKHHLSSVRNEEITTIDAPF